MRLALEGNSPNIIEVLFDTLFENLDFYRINILTLNKIAMVDICDVCTLSVGTL